MITILRTIVMGVLICWAMACARPDQDNPDTILSGARETEQLPEANAHPRLDSIGCTPGSPAVVELRGILVSIERFGPPGWGETPQQDERIRVPFLLLESPIVMCSTDEMVLPGEPPLKVDSVQLNFTQVTNEPMRWLGERITASGTISRAETGYHFGKVHMIVKQVQRSEQ